MISHVTPIRGLQRLSRDGESYCKTRKTRQRELDWTMTARLIWGLAEGKVGKKSCKVGAIFAQSQVEGAGEKLCPLMCSMYHCKSPRKTVEEEPGLSTDGKTIDFSTGRPQQGEEVAAETQLWPEWAAFKRLQKWMQSVRLWSSGSPCAVRDSWAVHKGKGLCGTVGISILSHTVERGHFVIRVSHWVTACCLGARVCK